jgi:hypothetical protein
MPAATARQPPLIPQVAVVALVVRAALQRPHRVALVGRACPTRSASEVLSPMPVAVAVLAHQDLRAPVVPVVAARLC